MNPLSGVAAGRSWSPHSSVVPESQPPAAPAQEAAEAAREAAALAREAAAVAARELAEQGVPQPPAPPSVGAPVAVSVPGIGEFIPMTREQVRAIDRRGTELSNQLTSAQNRRDRLVERLDETTSATDRAGLEARIAVLDERLVQLEKEIAANGELKASLANRMGSLAPEAPPQTSMEEWAGPIAFMTVVPIVLVLVRNLWKRGTRPPVVPISPQAEARFSQLEEAIDTVAVEIERVAEGQRFVTKLLREGQPVPDFTARAAGEPVEARRSREAGH